MVNIPLEIHQEIVHNLSGSIETLKACSLVCRAWLPSTRSLLFRAVKLSSDQACRDFKAVVKKSTTAGSNIARYVRDVMLSNLKLNMDNCVPDVVASYLAIHQLFSLLLHVKSLCGIRVPIRCLSPTSLFPL